MSNTIEITDSHCHLDYPDFENQLPEVIGRATANGITRMVSICTRLRNEPQVRAIAEKFDPVFYAVASHPISVAEEPLATVEELVAIAKHRKMVAIGETGLDYRYTVETMDMQKESLVIHIEAARQTGLPLIIHAREADEDAAKILTDEYRTAPYTCVMHCFSSGAELAQAALDIGFYLSMSGITAFPKSTELRDIFAAAPLDRILVETDAPFLAPPPYRGKVNEPSFVMHTAMKAAETFGVDYKDFAAQTQKNFARLFTKAN
jgi:TatD DNase family protein